MVLASLTLPSPARPMAGCLSPLALRQGKHGLLPASSSGQCSRISAGHDTVCGARADVSALHSRGNLPPVPPLYLACVPYTGTDVGARLAQPVVGDLAACLAKSDGSPDRRDRTPRAALLLQDLKQVAKVIRPYR
jgi:hypothetical protein